MEEKISADKLPKAALKKMSAAQRSYIDEFTFYRLPKNVATGDWIDAYYGGQYLATWVGKAGNAWLENPRWEQTGGGRLMKRDPQHGSRRSRRDVVSSPRKDPEI